MSKHLPPHARYEQVVLSRLCGSRSSAAEQISAARPTSAAAGTSLSVADRSHAVLLVRCHRTVAMAGCFADQLIVSALLQPEHGDPYARLVLVDVSSIADPAGLGDRDLLVRQAQARGLGERVLFARSLVSAPSRVDLDTLTPASEERAPR